MSKFAAGNHETRRVQDAVCSTVMRQIKSEVLFYFSKYFSFLIVFRMGVVALIYISTVVVCFGSERFPLCGHEVSRRG